MEVKNLSTTLISNWTKGCPKRAARSYLRRLELGDDNEGTNPTRFGTVVHAVLEEIHHDLMTGLLDDSDLDDDETIFTYYDRNWRENTCYDFEFYSFGKDKIGEFVRRSVRNRFGETIATELLFVYDAVTGKVWLADSRIEIRARVAEILAAGGVPVVSEIDRVDRDGNKLYVYDYKSNMLPFTRDEIETSEQLGLYDLAARALWPEAEEVECIFDMLRHGRFPVTFDDTFRANLRTFFVNLWHQIDQTAKPEERINKYCRWCEIRSACGAYKEMLDAPIAPILTEATDTAEGIAALWAESEKLANLLKIAEERQKEVKAILMAKVVTDGDGEPLQIGDREYYLIQNPRYEYDKHGVFKALQEAKSLTLLPDIMTVSKTNIDRLTKQRPELKAAMDPLMQKKFVTPTLKSRSLKGGTSANKDETNA